MAVQFWPHRQQDGIQTLRCDKAGKKQDARVSRILSENPKVALTLANTFSHRLQPGMDVTTFAHQRVSQWLDQFERPEDKDLALKLLGQMQVYNEGDIRQGCQDLYRWLEAQPDFDMKRARVVSLGEAKSGDVMHYHFRQANNLPERVSLSEQALDAGKPEGADTLIITDDIVGSGYSARTMISKHAAALSQYKDVYYLSLTGFPQGMETLREAFPDINFHALAVPNSVQENPAFSATEKEQIQQMSKRYAKRLGKGKRTRELANGYGGTQALVTYAHNTPNSTLPIFWQRSDHWEPLFPRYSPRGGRGLNSVPMFAGSGNNLSLLRQLNQ